LNLDLNLLAIFEAIERERSVTKAAKALGLSQPAVSHALNRLRHLFKDRLFVRSPSGMEPTPRALQMAGSVRQAVLQLQATLETKRFDPASSRDTFTIAMNNFAAIVFAAPLAAFCMKKAPNIRLVMRPSGTLDVDTLLNRGTLDLAITEIPDLPENDLHHLLDDHYVVVLRRGHPSAAANLTMRVFASLPHLKLSSIGEDVSFIDQELGRRKLSRSIQLEAPYIASARILTQSDMIGVVAKRIALELCSTKNVIWKELPFTGPTIRVGMRWPQIYDGRQGHQWLRSTLKHLVEDNRKA